MSTHSSTGERQRSGAAKPKTVTKNGKPVGRPPGSGAKRPSSAVPKPPKASVDTVHRNQRAQVAEFARVNGMTVAQYRRAVNEHVQELMRSAEVSVRAPDDRFAQILADGRIKTIFDEGTDVSKSATGDVVGNRRAQAGMQEFMFGIAPGASPESRPVYGYLTDRSGDIRGARQYGGVRMVLGPSAFARTTMVAGDTDVPNDQRASIARPARAMQWDALSYPQRPSRSGPQAWAQAHDPLHARSLTDLVHNGYNDYIEAHIHAGVRTSDIARVEFDHQPSDSTIERLRAAGIPWSVAGA